MKTTTQLVSAAMKTTSAGLTTADDNYKPGSALFFCELPRHEQGMVINEVFKKLKRTFAAQYLKYESSFEGDEWVNHQKLLLIKDESFQRLTAKQIEKGVDKACSGEFLPTMGKLIKCCKPSANDFGLPATLAAWTEACNHSHEVCSYQWTHQAVYNAGKKTGWHFIRTASGEMEVARIQRTFIDHYKSEVGRIESGEMMGEDAIAALDDKSQCSESEKAEQYGKFLVDQAVTQLGLPQRMSGAEALQRLRKTMVQQ